VLRRFHGRHDPTLEANVMAYLAERGFPVPAVHAVEGRDMVIERLEGRTLLDAIGRRPWRTSEHAAILADLHQRLHRIPAPPFLERGTDAGDAILHLDLHPRNVVMTTRGPVVIDWTSAARGSGSVDVALTWLILVSAKVPGGPIGRALAKFFGRRFVRAFLAHFDHADVAAKLPIAARYRLDDDELGDPERDAVREALERLHRKEARHGHPFELTI
jgi:aminoglycoside phosphotransferase (APT) family kinase protein